MGSLGKPSTRNRKFGALERQILDLIALEGQSYEYVLLRMSARTQYKFRRDLAAYRQRIKQAIKRLKDQKYLVHSGEQISITAAGDKVLRSVAYRNKSLLESKTWDGKWRIAIFDIPEEHASMRDRVRHVLKDAGFVMLQNSVWVFPHECEELVQLIKEESRLSKHILYGTLEAIQDDTILKKHFRLG